MNNYFKIKHSNKAHENHLVARRHPPIFGLVTPLGTHRARVANPFDPRAEFATVWPLKGWIQ